MKQFKVEQKFNRNGKNELKPANMTKMRYLIRNEEKGEELLNDQLNKIYKFASYFALVMPCSHMHRLARASSLGNSTFVQLFVILLTYV